MEFYDEYEEFGENSEEKIKERISKAAEFIESGDILLNLNYLEETVHICIDYDYPEEGLYIVNAVLETISYNAEFWSAKGVFHNSLGQLEEAQKAFETALELNPNDTETLINYAANRETIGDKEKALELLFNALEIEPTNIDALMGVAYVYEKSGEYENAIEHFRRVTELDEKYSEAWYELAFTLENLNRLEEAALAYQKYIDLEPESYFGWYNRGIVMLQMGNFKDAIDHFEFSTVLNKGFVSAFFNLGIANLTIGKYEDAAEAFIKAVEMNNEDEAAWYYLGKSYYGMKKYDKAIDAFDEALKLEGAYQEAYIDRGKAKEKSGDMQGALNDFNKALLVTVVEQTMDETIKAEGNEKNPMFTGVLRGIDKELNDGNLTTALNLIGFFESLFPDEPEILLRKSLIYFEYGDLAQGLNSLKDALKKDKLLMQEFRGTLAALKESELLKKIIDNNK